jgi:hypothetical protein
VLRAYDAETVSGRLPPAFPVTAASFARLAA